MSFYFLASRGHLKQLLWTIACPYEHFKVNLKCQFWRGNFCGRSPCGLCYLFHLWPGWCQRFGQICVEGSLSSSDPQAAQVLYNICAEFSSKQSQWLAPTSSIFTAMDGSVKYSDIFNLSLPSSLGMLLKKTHGLDGYRYIWPGQTILLRLQGSLPLCKYLNRHLLFSSNIS